VDRRPPGGEKSAPDAEPTQPASSRSALPTTPPMGSPAVSEARLAASRVTTRRMPAVHVDDINPGKAKPPASEAPDGAADDGE